MDLKSDAVDFTREYEFASSIVAFSSLLQKTFILATNTDEGQVYILVIDVHGNELERPYFVTGMPNTT